MHPIVWLLFVVLAVMVVVTVRVAREEAIVGGFFDYMRGFLERAHDVMSGLPVCPFAARARTEGKMDVRVRPFSMADVADGTWLAAALESFKSDDQHDLIMFVHPDVHGLFPQQVAEIAAAVQGRLGPDYVVFGGHPWDPYAIQGVFTRREPYPNFQVLRAADLRLARELLFDTGYYDKWSDEELARVGLKRDKSGRPSEA